MSDIPITSADDNKVQFTVVLGTLGAANTCKVLVDDSWTSNDDIIWSDEFTAQSFNVGVEVHCTITLERSRLAGVENLYVQAYKELITNGVSSIKYNPFVVAIPAEVSGA